MPQKPIKLHLGCQDKYLPGYINIDLPPKDHPVEKVKADVWADIRDLQYEPNSVDEIRSHHLLEHFSRHEALMLLAMWHRWLRLGGTVVIETPDFEESIRKFLATGIEDQFLLARHIYGSHEAEWGYHRDFWSEKKFKYILSALGYGDFRFEKFNNNLERKLPFLGKVRLPVQDALLRKLNKFGVHVLPSVVCYASKIEPDVDYKDVVTLILQKSLVGTETKMLEVWLAAIAPKL